MKKNKILVFITIFLLTIGLNVVLKGVLKATSLEELTRKILQSQLPEREKKKAISEAINTTSRSFPSLIPQNAGEVISNIGNLGNIQTPQDLIQAASNINPLIGQSLSQLYSGITGVIQNVQQSAQQIFGPPSSPSQPSPSQTSSTQPPQQSSQQPSPAQLIKPEGSTSLPQPPQQPPQQPSSPQIIHEFFPPFQGPLQLEYQGTTPAPSSQPSPPQSQTTTETQESKVRVYYCDRTTVQCIYTVVHISSADKPGYYRSLSDCQAKCRKAPYICYRYEIRQNYSAGTGCSIGQQCVPYASDTPCKNECTPSGAPSTGTAQQTPTQPQPSAQPSTNTTYYCTNICRGDKCISSATLYPCSNYKSCRSDADCRAATSGGSGGTTNPPTNPPPTGGSGGTSNPSACIRQEGKCPSSENCLRCPSGYYKEGGGCQGCPRTGYNCYIKCCPRR